MIIVYGVILKLTGKEERLEYHAFYMSVQNLYVCKSRTLVISPAKSHRSDFHIDIPLLSPQ